MKKTWKKLAIGLVIFLIVIQLFHPAKNISNTPFLLSNDISRIYGVPDSVKIILKASCYDCHSDSTSYPWYANIQPVSWWLNNHIEEGKRHLNFSDFISYRVNRQYKKFEEIIESVKEGDMPLSSYTIIHKNAVLSKEKKAILTNWAAAAREGMKEIYPADSLVRK